MPTLTLRGQTLRCIENMPPGPLMDMATVQATDSDPFASLAAIRRILFAVVIPEDHALLNQHLYDSREPLDIGDLATAVGNTLAEYSERPTVRPSQSPTGSGPTGGDSRVVSLSPVTESEGEESYMAGIYGA